MTKSTRLASAMQKDFLGVAEVADLLEVRPITIYRWCRSGRLPSIKIGKEWRISRAALNGILRNDQRQWLAHNANEGAAMREVSPATKDLAHQLLWHEAGGRLDPDVLAAAAERVFDRLRRRLTDLLGQAGFIALFKRALRLAQAEFPILSNLAVGEKPEERLIGLHELGTAHAQTSVAIAAASTALLAQLIWLLVTFVGNDLTVRLIDEIWPELAQTARDPSTQIWSDDA